MSQILVINRVRVLGSGPHTPTQCFWEYPPPLGLIFSFLCDLVLTLRCFLIQYLQVSVNLKVILFVSKITQPSSVLFFLLCIKVDLFRYCF